MKKIVNITVTELTDEVLSSFLSLAQIPGDRDLEPRRVKWLRKLINDGEFATCDWADVFCKETGRIHRGNGQHSSYVLDMCRRDDMWPSVPYGIPVTIEHWQCDLLSELLAIFDRFDNPKSQRTATDKTGVHSARHKVLMGIDKNLIRQSLAGVDWYLKKIRTDDEEMIKDEKLESPPDAYDRGTLLNYEVVRDFVLWIHELDGGMVQPWKRVPGAAMLFRAFTEDEEAATEIWSSVCDDDAPRNSLLHEIAQSCREQSFKGKKRGNKPEQIFTRLYRMYNKALRELKTCSTS